VILFLFFTFSMLVTVGAILWSAKKTPAQKMASARLIEIAKKPNTDMQDRQIALSTTARQVSPIASASSSKTAGRATSFSA
jgi:hypothetical protein